MYQTWIYWVKCPYSFSNQSFSKKKINQLIKSSIRRKSFIVSPRIIWVNFEEQGKVNKRPEKSSQWKNLIGFQAEAITRGYANLKLEPEELNNNFAKEVLSPVKKYFISALDLVYRNEELNWVA